MRVKEKWEGGWNCHTRRGFEPRLRRESLNLPAWGANQVSRQHCGSHLEMCYFPSGTQKSQSHFRHAQLPQTALCVPESFVSPNGRLRLREERGLS